MVLLQAISLLGCRPRLPGLPDKRVGNCETVECEFSPSMTVLCLDTDALVHNSAAVEEDAGIDRSLAPFGSFGASNTKNARIGST
jgi:hypothetical protein